MEAGFTLMLMEEPKVVAAHRKMRATNQGKMEAIGVPARSEVARSPASSAERALD